MSILGVISLTPDSLLVRELSSLPNFTVVLYKYTLFASILCTILFSVDPKSFLSSFTELGIIGTCAGIVWGASNFLITVAFQTTEVANVLVISAASPLFSTVFSYLVLRELSPMRTIFASMICFSIIMVIFYSQLGAGVGGVLCAIGGSSSMAMYFVLIRLYMHSHNKEPNMLAVNAICAVVVVFVSLVFQPELSALTGRNLGLLIANGMVVLPVSFFFLAIGPSLITPAEVSLYMLLETIFGPLWVWLAGYEAPPLIALIGGVILIFTLAGHSILALREESMEYQKVKNTGKQVNDGTNVFIP